MEITIRNKGERKINLKEGVSIEELLLELGINRETVLVTKNGEISIEDEILKDGDVIEIISVISGG